MNTTIVVAIITALSTTIPTLVTVYLNNRHQLKVKKFEQNVIPKRNAIIEFSDVVASISSTSNALPIEQANKFHKAANQLVFFFPDIDLDLIEQIHKSLFEKNVNSKNHKIRALIIELSKSLPEI